MEMKGVGGGETSKLRLTHNPLVSAALSTISTGLKKIFRTNKRRERKSSNLPFLHTRSTTGGLDQVQPDVRGRRLSGNGQQDLKVRVGQR